VTEPGELADRIRAAYEGADLAAFGALLAEDARWGDDDHPHRCRSRADVLGTFERWLGSGVTAQVLGVESGSDGVLCRLHVNWTDPDDRPRGTDFVHVFLIHDGLITELRRYDDLASAAEAIGTRSTGPSWGTTVGGQGGS
jgi:ketosteroid isomerase-like protein